MYIRCLACDSSLLSFPNTMLRDIYMEKGYCPKCENHIRTVFDSDAHSLGQGKAVRYGLDYTGQLVSEDYSGEFNYETREDEL